MTAYSGPLRRADKLPLAKLQDIGLVPPSLRSPIVS
jgi:hypothetical protein